MDGIMDGIMKMTFPILGVITVAVTIFGLFWSSWKQRVLQRKQLAVNILSRNRFQEKWVNSLASVFKIIRNDKDFNWIEIAQNCFDPRCEISDDQQKVYENIKCVLNHLEFIAIAVLNRAIDEDIVKLAYSHYYQELSKVLGEHIKKTRELLNDEAIYINFTTLAEKWKGKPAVAQPGSGWW